MSKDQAVADALRDVLVSPNESDANLEAANVVDGLFAVARAVKAHARGIYPDAVPTTDQHGQYVASLTEAVLSVSFSLTSIAHAINTLASAIEQTQEAQAK